MRRHDMALKRYSEDETPTDARCYDCGFPYESDGWIETSVPDEVWDIIKPTEGGGGLLCINCISVRCAEAGLSNVPIQFCGTEPLIPVWAFPRVVKCKHCNAIVHIVAPDLSGLLAYGWWYDEPHGWVCPKHSRRTR